MHSSTLAEYGRDPSRIRKRDYQYKYSGTIKRMIDYDRHSFYYGWRTVKYSIGTLPMSQLTRYKENPFLKDMVIPVKDRKIQISPLGKDNNILVNQSTGEIIGTHVTTYKKVDGEQFIKLFTANIGLTFDLTSSGIKVFTVMLWAVQNRAITKDQVDLELLTLEAFHEAHANDSKPLKLSESTYRRGLTELCKAQIIAKSVKLGRYFINPNFVFNGDRIAFTTLIERKREKPTSSNMELN